MLCQDLQIRGSNVLNPFPNKPWFSRVCSKSLLKTQWEKEKLLVTSNFSFSHSVFYSVGDLSAIFINSKIAVCKLFQFGRASKLSFGREREDIKKYTCISNSVGGYSPLSIRQEYSNDHPHSIGFRRELIALECHLSLLFCFVGIHKYQFVKNILMTIHTA